MNDADITAFSAAPLPPAPPRRKRLTPWRWALLLVLVFGVLALCASAALLSTLSDLSGNGVHITVDDETFHFGAGHGGAALLAVGAAFAALLAVLCIVPVVVALALAAAALGIGIALFAVLAVAAVALSPLWLPVLLIWWAVRPARPRPAAAA